MFAHLFVHLMLVKAVFFDYVRKLKKGRKVDLQEFWGENLCCETAGIGKQKKNEIKEREKNVCLTFGKITHLLSCQVVFSFE